jgi:hypothetical protein
VPTVAFYQKQSEILADMANAVPDPQAAAALRARAAEYSALARTLAETETPASKSEPAQQQQQPAPGRSSEPVVQPSEPSVTVPCRVCGQAMRLTRVQPDTRYSNLDQCEFECACGHTTSHYVARME